MVSERSDNTVTKNPTQATPVRPVGQLGPPTQATPVRPVGQLGPPTQATPVRPVRVLVVDDDENLIRAASLRLSAAGYDTKHAANGVEGLRLAKAILPEAIILDIRMPKKDGLTVLAELQEDIATKDIPVVVVSASIKDQHRALKAGARYFLAKPYDGKMLVATLRAIRPPAHSPAVDAADPSPGPPRPSLSIYRPNS